MGCERDRLEELIAGELESPVPAPIVEAAGLIRRRYQSAVAAVIFYGSCLRARRSEAELEREMVDFYVLVHGYRRAHGSLLLALANALLPPNVFYLELPCAGVKLRAKCAVVSLAQFERGTSERCFEPLLWARFAQSSRLVYASDELTRRRVIGAITSAALKMVGECIALAGSRFSPEDLWVRGLENCYRTEIRAEAAGPAAREIYLADPARYDRVAALAMSVLGIAATPSDDSGLITVGAAPSPRQAAINRARWRRRRVAGKLLAIARLVKGAFTFDGAVDYMLWKIERHTGARAPAPAWQRRHPVLGGPIVAWRLYRRGGFR